MNEPTFDKDGYPTDETLDAIKKWPCDDFKSLMAFCKTAWRWEDYFNTVQVENELVCTVHTGGWSGNESIVIALQDNMMFWALCWQQSKRGGHYIFKVK
jgi:hypothetical protein